MEFLAEVFRIFWMEDNLQVEFEENNSDQKEDEEFVYIKVSHYLLKSYSISMAFDKKN